MLGEVTLVTRLSEQGRIGELTLHLSLELGIGDGPRAPALDSVPFATRLSSLAGTLSDIGWHFVGYWLELCWSVVEEVSSLSGWSVVGEVCLSESVVLLEPYFFM